MKTGMRAVLLFMGFILGQANGIAQNSESTAEIRQLILSKNFEAAGKLSAQKSVAAIAAGKTDSLPVFIKLFGTAIAETDPADQAIKKFQDFFNANLPKIKDPKTLQRSWLAAAAFYEDFDRNHLAYVANREALKFAKLISPPVPGDISSIENDLGVFAQRMGNVQLSKQHHQTALKLREEARPINYEDLYQSYNSIGGILWYASSMDSSKYYFLKALDALAKVEQNPYNKFYRPAVVLNNISALYNLEGNITKAIDAMRTAISDIQLFLDSPDPHPKKKTARTFLYQAIDNLAGFYKEMGNFTEAKELLQYSYRQKKIHSDPNSPEIYKSEVMLGVLYNEMRDFARAEPFLKDGLRKATGENGDGFNAGDAAYGLALLYEKQGKSLLAAEYYTKADSLYSVAYAGDYDNIYLEFIRNASLFYADNERRKEALDLAFRNYNYVKEKKPTKTLLPFYEALNLSEVYYRSGSYKESLVRSEEALKEVNSVLGSGANLTDSVRIEIKKPKAILMQAKSQYMLRENRDSNFLKSLLVSLQKASQILERRNALLKDPENSGLMLSYHEELMDFIKQIEVELFQLTGNKQYVDQLLSLHESGMYHRIRARLDKNDAIQFAGIPAAVRNREMQIRKQISDAVTGEDVGQYLSSQKTWSEFLDDIRKKYPEYYSMRFGTIFKPVAELMHRIPENTQIVRYVYAGKNLYAVVLDQHDRYLIALDANDISEQIETLNDSRQSAATVMDAQYRLYQALWQPLENKISRKRIVIIPDRILYNISFESLTPKRIRQFSELRNNSLLATYALSYQYSLFLIQQPHSNEVYETNYTAFAPVFSDDIKKDYLGQHIDSIDIDNGYLSLLPLPFTLSLVNRTSELLGGTTYVMDQSTLPAFRQFAGNSSILHIGTHAEANNLYPEYSRLIFAKDKQHPLDTNSLFLFDIYNCSLQSALTVLTACETGKPGFKDGEGMISLGHAFNYAGSESILTSLWRIDEQSSTMIMTKFYELLEKGLNKDEALREAKLNYLANAHGRMLAPQYWAGMVLVGDADKIVLKKRTSWKLFAGGTVFIVLIAGMLYRKRMRKMA